MSIWIRGVNVESEDYEKGMISYHRKD